MFGSATLESTNMQLFAVETVDQKDGYSLLTQNYSNSYDALVERERMPFLLVAVKCGVHRVWSLPGFSPGLFTW